MRISRPAVALKLRVFVQALITDNGKYAEIGDKGVIILHTNELFIFSRI